MSRLIHVTLWPTVLALLLCPGMASAQRNAGPPARTVRDDANLFSAEAEKEANAKIARMRSQFKKDLFIETVGKLALPESVDAKNAEKVNQYVSEWAKKRFKDERVNGVYVAIIKEPRKFRVEVGKKTTELGFFTPENRRELTKKLEPALKDPDKALLMTADYVMNTFSQHSQAGVTAGRPEGPGGVKGEREQLPAWMGYLCIGIGVLAVLGVIMAVIRSASAGGGGYGAPGAAGGGGGFFQSLLGGLFGAAAGMWLYNNFFGGHHQAYGGENYPTSMNDPNSDVGAGDPYEGGGDWDGGGDAGGGDWGGDGGGGDW